MSRWIRTLSILLSMIIAAVTLTAPPATAASGYVFGGDPFQSSNGGRCTVSFTVVGQVTPFTGFLTAGHCVQAGAPVYTLGGELLGYGSVVTNSYALVQLIPGWTPRGIRYGGRMIPLTGSIEAPVGASVCRVGSTTGWRCGTIQAKNQTVHFPGGVVYGLTRTNVCTEPGDTGAPYIAGTQAQGILVGGSGNCTTGGTSYFQPVNKILAAHGLQLVTG